MKLGDMIAAKLATGEAHSFWLTRHDAALSIPDGDALRAAFSPGATWANVACVAVHAAMAGAGRLAVYRVSTVAAWLNAGGFDVDYLTAMPSAHGGSLSYEIDAAGFRGIGFNDAMSLDLWDSPIIVKNGASGGMVQAAIQNDSGAAKGYTLALKMVAWQ